MTAGGWPTWTPHLLTRCQWREHILSPPEQPGPKRIVKGRGKQTRWVQGWHFNFLRQEVGDRTEACLSGCVMNTGSPGGIPARITEGRPGQRGLEADWNRGNRPRSWWLPPCHLYEIMALPSGICRRKFFCAFVWVFLYVLRTETGIAISEKMRNHVESTWLPTPRMPGCLFCSAPDSPSDFGLAMPPPGLQSHLSLSLRALSTPHSTVF